MTNDKTFSIIIITMALITISTVLYFYHSAGEKYANEEKEIEELQNICKSKGGVLLLGLCINKQSIIYDK